jgi:hypothetical protein
VTQENRVHKLLHLSQAPYVWQDKEIVDFSRLAGVKLAVVDAVACLESDKSPIFDGGGYSKKNIINRVRMNTIVAGTDPVAVDHICARMIGLNPDDFEYITLAERIGLGTNNDDSITVLGTPVEQVRRPFKKAQTWSGLYGQGNRTWLVNGPFTALGAYDPMKHEFIPGESTFTAKPGVENWSQPLYFTNDQIMLNDYFGQEGKSTDNVVSYAFTYVVSPADQAAELWVGSDEAIKMYLNGHVVYDFEGVREFAGRECYKDTVTVALQKGRNRLLVKALQTLGNYNFSVNICDVESNPLFRGNRVWGLKFTTDVETPDAIAENSGKEPDSPGLLECYPNPFNPTTRIRYNVGRVVVPSGASFSGVEGPVSSRVRLAIYDLLGREVAVLVNERKAAGSYQVEWNGSGRASGIYFCRLFFDGIPWQDGGAPGSARTIKMLLLK